MNTSCRTIQDSTTQNIQNLKRAKSRAVFSCSFTFLSLVLFVVLFILFFNVDRMFKLKVEEMNNRIDYLEEKIDSIPVCYCYCCIGICPLDEVWNYIILYDLIHPEIVFAQFLEETGWGTSRIFLEYGNPFGMKMVERRPTTQLNRHINMLNSTWGFYSSIELAVVDKMLWQESIASITRCMSEEEYLELLGRIYAESPKYIQNLRRILNQIRSNER